jgi:hypothetical protein
MHRTTPRSPRDQIVLTEAGEIRRKRGVGSGLASTPADHSDKFLNTLQRFAVAARQLGEDLALAVLKRLTHARNEHDAPGGPAIARKRATQKLLVGEGFPEGDPRLHAYAYQI